MSAVHRVAGGVRRVLLESRYGLVGLVFLLFVIASGLTRLALLVLDRALIEDAAGEVVRALAVGAVFDTVTALWMAAPLALYLTVVPEAWRARRGHRRFLFIVVAALVYLACFVAAAEYFFFDEFNGRFNFVAVDYLVYPTEVVNNIWESYHIVWAVGLLAALTWLLLRLARRPLRHALDASATLAQRGTFIAGFMLLLAALTVTVRPTMARVSNDRALNEVASNGYYTFFQALLGVDAAYEGWYASRPPAEIRPRLRRLLTDAAADSTTFDDSTTLRVERGTGPARRLNVVLVLEESFGSKFVGALHPDGPSVTPAFDSLVAEGTLLTRAYSSGNRTIRALEATSSSLPPLPGIATVRRSQSRGLFTLASLLRSRGYRTMFVYGGRAMFDNMGRYMLDNGMDRVIEQKDYPDGTYTTAWGVSDEAIFDKALAEMDSLHATRQPFYAMVLTVSNHKPYTYPAGRIAEDPAKKRRTHAVRYADFALGRFIRMARSHAFFDSTLFVLMGDHGARVYGKQQIPLPSYEIPILFYGPGIVRAGVRVPTLASAVDIPPTIMGVLGGDYESRFFGTDVFRQDSAAGRAFMTHNAEIALMRGDRVVVLGLRERADLFRVDTATQKFVPIATPDSAGRALIEDAIAYYNGADRVYREGRYQFDTLGRHSGRTGGRGP